jgi:uncharacterized membrane protein
MRQSLVAIPIMHVLMYIAIGFDLPVFRQIIVFIYLTFVPGFILLRFIKLKETKIVDIVLFSVGLSLAFLMFVGFFINQLLLIVGVSQPLSTIPLEITLSVVTLMLFYVGYRPDLFEGFSSWRSNAAGSREVFLQSAILFLPVLLGIIGALHVSVPSISVPILSFMVTAVAALFVVSLFSRRLIPSKFYPLMIFAISTALIFHILLISKYIIGYDANLEYQVFRLTINRGYWNLLPVDIHHIATSDLNSMLSLTVLPSTYSALLNLDGTALFKILYPFVFSLVPVVLYRIWERQIGKASSLLSTLFLVSSPLAFYGIGFLSLNRQIVAMFFLVLSILALLDKTMAVGKRRILLIVFGAAMTVSHYSTTYLYLGLVFSAYAISRIRGNKDRVLNGPLVLLLSIMVLSWYTYTTAPLTTLGTFLQRVLSRFSEDIYSPAARSTQVFASHSVLTFASATNWVLFVTVHCMIFVGILIVLFKPRKAKLDSTYRILLSLSSVVLFLSLAVPNVAPALDFSRFYELSLLFLAPCFVLGGEALVDNAANLLRRMTRRSFLGNTHQIRTALLCAVLAGYFLSQSGFINLVTEAAPQSYSLDFNRFATSTDPNLKGIFYSAYIQEQNFFSAVWLSKHAEPQSIVYADFDSYQNVLMSYGMIPMQYLVRLSNSTVPTRNTFVYLSSLNVGDGVMTYMDFATTTIVMFNTSEISPILNNSNLIYSSGNGEIWYVTSSG